MVSILSVSCILTNKIDLGEENTTFDVTEVVNYANVESCDSLLFQTQQDTFFDSWGNSNGIITYGYDIPRIGEYYRITSKGDTFEKRFFKKIENPCENNKEIRVGTHEIKSIYGCPLFIEFYSEGVLIKREFHKSTCD